MPLILQLVNETTLPDGGPVSFRLSGKRGIDIGRAAHLDWTLPDPTRYVSSKHCEIRYKDGGYWLHDVSTNGTFLNGADNRMHAPHRLRNGDQFTVGHYIVAVTVDGTEEASRRKSCGAAQPPVQFSSDQALWADGGNVPPASIPSTSDLLAIMRPFTPIFWIGRRTFLIRFSRLRTSPHRLQQGLCRRPRHPTCTGQRLLRQWCRRRRSLLPQFQRRASQGREPTRADLGRRLVRSPQILHLSLRPAMRPFLSTHCRSRTSRASLLPPSYASLLDPRVSPTTFCSGRTPRSWRRKSARCCVYLLKTSCSS